MIVPSIDLQNGRAVQLRQGKAFALDGGDPFERLDAFAVAGEVAVIDLDAAMGTGSNADIIRAMVRRAPCRVGGGIRDLATARAWLDAGAARVILGTAASVDLCSQLPRARVMAAVDSYRGDVVVEGWRTKTGADPVARVRALAPAVGGFLVTQVEREGEMGGFDRAFVDRVADAAGEARVTAAGGITTADDVAWLDARGIDAQVGMALYTGRLPLGQAVAAVLRRGIEDREWPTVVCDENGATLGLVWSTRETVADAVESRRGIYWSRSRAERWVKGESSGQTQELLRVDVDCDRDALRFTVRQHGTGFCHTGSRGCWPTPFSAGELARVIATRRSEAPPDSGTRKLFDDPQLLAAKLREEADELTRATTIDETIHEVADLIYFALVTAEARGAAWRDVERELARRHGGVSRRPMQAKEDVT